MAAPDPARPRPDAPSLAVPTTAPSPRGVGVVPHHGAMSGTTAAGLPPAPGMLLVAAPTLLDPNFVDTVVLLLDADDEGAIGVVLNRPTPVPVEEVLPDWGPVVAEPEVLFQGGPVSTEGALAVALLEDGVVVPDTGFRPVAGPFGLVDLDTPVDALAGRLAGVRIFAGYAGWGAGQLEEEIEEGAWYVVPAEAGDLTREDAVDLARDVLRRQPGELAWHSTRPADPDLN